MSREIEFRAWSKSYKEIVKVDLLGKNKVLSSRTWFDFNDIELMQYTGIKDKNGVKIFEGDIVSCKVYSLDYETWETDDIGEVVYDDDCCAYFIYFKEGCIHLTSAWNLEVIGNIYENPELLEVNE